MNKKFKTKIFLDSGDPEETKKTVAMLGFLDGQTTNPSLVAKNPKLQSKVGKLTQQELYQEYKSIIQEINSLIPQGSVSIEVYADKSTSVDHMVQQAQAMSKWIDSPHIKLPTILPGLEAAEILVREGVQVNMTLCFSQQQAAGVYNATKEMKSGLTFVSPFIGRLDDIGYDGMDLIKNISRMYTNSDHHTQLLAASIRSVKHLLYLLFMEVDIVTVPFSVLEEWDEMGMPLLQDLKDDEKPTDSKKYLGTQELKPIEYEELDLNTPFSQFNLQHELTDKGLEKFSQDWNKLLSNNA